MDEDLERILRGRIAALRARRSGETKRTLAEVAASFQGRTTNSRYPIELSQAAAAEFDARVDLWLDTIKHAFQEHDFPWTQHAAGQVHAILSESLVQDQNELVGLLQERVQDRRTGGDLTAAMDRAPRFLRSELDLLVYAEERHRTPLAEQLAAPRYRSVRQAWAKGQAFLDADGGDSATAVKESVGAVEQLARLIVEQPSATLGDAIKVLRSTGRVRAPLLKGLEEMWVMGVL